MAAAVSVNLVNFPTLFRSPQLTGRASSLNLVSVAWRQTASSRTSGFQISCSAKPATVEKVVEIVKKQLALPDDKELTPESKFAELGADSLDTVEIVMGLEEEFDITVEEDGSQNITTVQEAADLIEDLLEKKAKA